MTTPFGSLEQPFDAVDIVKAAGANYVARATSFHAQMMDKLITNALDHPGFSLVEVFSPCPTQYGRKNKFRNIVDMYEWLKKNTVKVDNMKDNDTRIPIGVFQDKRQPGLEERYAALQQKLTSPAETVPSAPPPSTAEPTPSTETAMPDSGTKA